MKPAREPASSRPKPCAFLKKPHESCPFAAPCGPRRKKNDRGQRSAFPSETSRFKPVILAHRGSALPWLVNDRAALRLRRIWWKVITRTEAVVALRMMAASAGKNPAQFALHSGRFGGATKRAAQGMTELHIQRAGRWKSRAFMVYIRYAGEGAQKVSAAPTREG